MVAPTATRRRFSGFAFERTVRPRIDKQAGIIYDVLICGTKSRNRRKYLFEALEPAIPKYEGALVFCDHEKDKRKRIARAKSIENHAGVLRNVYLAKDGLRGELHYNRQTKAGLQVLEIAERFPGRGLGLSQHVDYSGFVVDDTLVVDEIREVFSVDAVVAPATTDGLFEQEETTEETSSAPSIADAFAALINAVHADTSLDDDGKLKATKAVMKLKKELLGGSETETEPTEAEATEQAEPLTLEAIGKLIDQKLAAAKKRGPTPPKSTPRQTGTGTEQTTTTTKTTKLPNGEKEILQAWGVVD